VADDLQTTQMRHLIDRIQQGDREALEELLRLSAGRMERLARSMLRRYPQVRGHEQTADVVQAATMSLMAALRQLKFASTRDYYGLAAEHIRRRLLDLARRYRRPGREHVSLDEAAVAEGSAEKRDVDLGVWEALHEAVEKLPADQREAFGLKLYHGWEQAQIAELFQCSTKTVQRLLLRAQLSLGDLLGGRRLPGGEGEAG
jgi:RNA polymerase sigma factor (sigma-70 family)